MLGWESGIAMGVGLGYGLLEGDTTQVMQVSLALTVAALLMYNFLTHDWFLRHKNR
jgi:hypothetical protein